ncbi:MAG: sirohydrochlorin chelatase [Gemmataceae bacterium]
MKTSHDTADNARAALLLMAHGSRNTEANADLFHVAEQIKARGEYSIVQASFLELADPDIERGGQMCVEQGAAHVLMLPYFLSAGVHVRSDLTEIRNNLASQFSEVSFVLGKPLGRHPLLIDVLMERAREAQKTDSQR